MKKVTIYLVDLCHNQYGLARSSISLGIGTIGAYLIKKFGEKVNVKLFLVYGPGQKFNRLIPFIIRSIIKKGIPVYGSFTLRKNENIKFIEVNIVKKIIIYFYHCLMKKIILLHLL